MMISIWHLLWIVPISIVIGIFMVSICEASRSNFDDVVYTKVLSEENTDEKICEE